MGLLTNSLASIDKKLLLPFLLCGVIYITIIHPLFFGPLSRVPGPPLCKITSYYLLFFDFFYARNTRVHQWHQKYGPILCIGPREVSLSSPTHMRTIYTSTSRFDKSAYFDKFTAYGERAMFSTLSYHDHQAKRRMLSSFYQATNIKNASILGFIRERARSFISSLDKERRTKKEVNIFPLVNRFAFDNITRLLYGEDHGTYSLEDDTSSQTLLNDLKKMQFLGPLQINFPILHAILSAIIQRFWPQKAGGFSVAQRLESWNISKIASVTQTSAPESLSLLNRLLSTKDTPNPDSIACELLDNVNAQETVGVALTYFIWHLSLHQKWQDQIRSELKALPITEDGFPSMSNIESAILLEAFLKEVYRVNPGSSGRAERLVPLGGRFFDTVFLPENTIISASTIALHQDPVVFPEPTAFKPERWLISSPAHLKLMENSFIPFGYGSRICMGKAFATIEIKMLLWTLYVRFKTRIGEGMRESDMRQTGTQDALPWGMRCDVVLEED